MQIRVKLPSSNPLVYNKVLLIDTRRFKHYFNTFYEKKFTRGSKEIVENYQNGNLWMFSETEYFTYAKVTNCYGNDGEIFSIEKIFYDNNGNPFKQYHKIYNFDDTVLEYTDLV